MFTYIDIVEKSTSKSVLHRQSSSPQQQSPIGRQPPPRRQVSSSSDNTPVQILKMGCESAWPRKYTYNLEESSTGVHQMFQFLAIVKDSTGRVLCREKGSKKDSKKQAKHDAASKANAKLGFK